MKTHLHYVPELAELAGRFKSKLLLDYGCGDGGQYSRERIHVVWGGETPTLYEPRKVTFSNRPVGLFDGVICCDFLDTADPAKLPEYVRDIAAHAKDWAFIACRRDLHDWIKQQFPPEVLLVIVEPK